MCARTEARELSDALYIIKCRENVYIRINTLLYVKILDAVLKDIREIILKRKSCFATVHFHFFCTSSDIREIEYHELFTDKPHRTNVSLSFPSSPLLLLQYCYFNLLQIY